MLVAVTSGGSGSMRTSSISGEYGVARLQAITLGHDATGWKTAKAGDTHSVGPASRYQEAIRCVRPLRNCGLPLTTNCQQMSISLERRG